MQENQLRSNLKKDKITIFLNLKNLRKKLKKKENDLIAKKNILSQDEFQKKLTELRKDVINYQRTEIKL